MIWQVCYSFINGLGDPGNVISFACISTHKMEGDYWDHYPGNSGERFYLQKLGPCVS